LEQQQRYLDQELELQAQVAQRQALAAEALLVMQARVDEERQAVQAEQDKIAAEHAAMSRAKELIEAAKRQREESIQFVAEATEQRVTEEQRVIQAEQAQLQAEQAACKAARERVAISEQAEQLAVRQYEKEQMLLVQQQVRLENERQILLGTEIRLKSEIQASAALEEREEAIEQRTRETAQIKAMFAQEATLVAQQLAELERIDENIQLPAQIDQSRAGAITRRLMIRLGKIKQIGRMGKAIGIISAMAIIGFSLPEFHVQKIDTVQSATVDQPVRAEMKQPEQNQISTVQGESKLERVNSPTNLAFGDLKITDHLGE
jgi:hypothetical protein